jgi:hypothetical protein
MNNLHSLGPTNPTALIWFQPRDGRGHALGKPRGHQYDFENHLYRVPRGIPPPLLTEEEGIALNIAPWEGRIRRDTRHAWIPYGTSIWNPLRGWERPTIEFIRNPLCGPIRTQAREGSFYATHNRWGEPILCQTCLAISEGQFQADLINLDPWTLMRRNGQTDLPDPISGQ